MKIPPRPKPFVNTKSSYCAALMTSLSILQICHPCLIKTEAMPIPRMTVIGPALEPLALEASS